MDLSLISIALASGESSGSFFGSLINQLVNPLIIFLTTLGVILFLYGIVRYLLNPADENIRTESKKHLVWGLIGMLIMFSVFGIINIIIKTLGS